MVQASRVGGAGAGVSNDDGSGSGRNRWSAGAERGRKPAVNTFLTAELRLVKAVEGSELVKTDEPSLSCKTERVRRDSAGGRMSVQDERLEMSPYAPVRYQRNHFWQLANEGVDRGSFHKDGRIDAGVAKAVQGRLSAVFDIYVQRLGSREHPLFPVLQAEAVRWAAFTVVAGFYIRAGRQIFDFSDRCLAQVRATDVHEEVTLEGLELPYDTFFMRFGRLDDAKAEYREDPSDPMGFEYVDGAFIHRRRSQGEEGLLIGLTTVTESGRGMTRAPYILTIQESDFTKPWPEAIDEALKREREEHVMIAESDNPITRATYQQTLSALEDAHMLLRGAMPTVLSALFWLLDLESMPDPEPGRDTSSDRVAHWKNADLKRRGKLRGKLVAEGYTLVRLIDRVYDEASTDGVGGGLKSTHFRRAHWRKQPYGPRTNPTIKRIRIPQAYVNPRNNAGTSAPGHIYVPGTDTPQ